MPSSKELPPSTAPFFPNIYLKNQLCAKPVWPSKEKNSLADKVAIITGSNQGLGFECARQLLSLGLSRLILSVRSISKGEEAARKLRAEYPKATFDVYAVDMTSYDSVQAFVEKTKLLERLDIAILNAGVMPSSFTTIQSTGHEETFQTTPIFPTFDIAENFSMDTYNITKLLLMMYLYKLVDYVSAEDVIVNIVDPGYVKGTNLQRDKGFLMRVFMKGMDVSTARTIDVGASTYVDAAVIQRKESHGSYLMGWKISPFATMMYSAEGKQTIEQVWKETE